MVSARYHATPFPLARVYSTWDSPKRFVPVTTEARQPHAFLEQRTVARNPRTRARAAMFFHFFSVGQNVAAPPKTNRCAWKNTAGRGLSQGRLRIFPLHPGGTRAPSQPQGRPKGPAEILGGHHERQQPYRSCRQRIRPLLRAQGLRGPGAELEPGRLRGVGAAHRIRRRRPLRGLQPRDGRGG